MQYPLPVDLRPRNAPSRMGNYVSLLRLGRSHAEKYDLSCM